MSENSPQTKKDAVSPVMKVVRFVVGSVVFTFLGVIALVAVMILVSFFPTPLTSPPNTTYADVPSIGLNVGVKFQSISFQNEYDRWLVVKKGDKSVETKLIRDWGPADRLSLYIQPNGNLAVIQATVSPVIINTATLTAVRYDLNDQGDDWSYVGAFDMVDTYPDEERLFVRGRKAKLLFIPPSAQAECNAALGESTYPELRKPSQAQRCQDLGYALSSKQWRARPSPEEILAIRDNYYKAHPDERH